jgi:hypothetical protein
MLVLLVNVLMVVINVVQMEMLVLITVVEVIGALVLAQIIIRPVGKLTVVEHLLHRHRRHLQRLNVVDGIVLIVGVAPTDNGGQLVKIMVPVELVEPQPGVLAKQNVVVELKVLIVVVELILVAVVAV